MYNYFCEVVRIIDGDTVDVNIDLGFGVWLYNQRIRLVGIDAPETRTRDLEEKAAGYTSREFVEKMLPIKTRQILVSNKYNPEKGSFGRILGDFMVYDSQYDCECKLTTLMLRYGYAEEYVR